MRNEIDTKEVVGLVDGASGSFAVAGETFQRVAALFGALVKALPEHSEARQLALLGEDLCEDRAETFLAFRDDYNAHTERFVNGGAYANA
ncbi:hypothetical protein GXB81_22995 [Paraburkholderia sp. Ac-20336]|uniref:hypothetical protein n=1 Tax=Paraburkholderia sp. Ac-20336 TaxID=2703886 RepID=UPI001981738E|nr:hypothetical protein [Paraburkholderia sp. Ac-20336]MBN3805896.1 hypothetical protein [Paraburkholderia sp. Ac-20336]